MTFAPLTPLLEREFDMSFSTASLLSARPRQHVAVHHGLERQVVLMNDWTLHVSTQATYDRNIRINNDPLYPVSFTGDQRVQYDVAGAAALALNALSADQRHGIIGNREKVRTDSLMAYVEDGVIFAHQPVCDKVLELYLVPVVTAGHFGPRVLQLHSCRNLWGIKSIR